MQQLSRETEIRHLNPIHRRQIEELLNLGDSWKELVTIIPKENNLNNLLISNKNYRILEQQKCLNFQSPSKIFIDFWSTYGKIRPTLNDLIHYSEKINLKRLTKYLIVDVLNENLSEEILNQDESLKSQIVNFNDSGLTVFDKFENELSTEIINIFKTLNTNIEIFNFNDIYYYTDKFNNYSLKDCGRKLGEGNFGEVYLAIIPHDKLNNSINRFKSSVDNNYFLAVKILKNDFRNQFLNELKLLLTFKHKNILEILGISFNQDKFGLLFEYIKNGSLQKCLEKSSEVIIPYQNRIQIIGEIIEGICYLHSFKDKPLVHRDIKSSNILIGDDFNVKICDFGFSKLVILDKTINSSHIIGTSVYMAPEAFKGDISIKLDTFSFGVVLLEILTGLPPINYKNESLDILSYVQENIFEDSEDEMEFSEKISEYLDKRAGKWNLLIAIKLFNLAKECTNNRKKKRPVMNEVKKIYLNII